MPLRKALWLVFVRLLPLKEKVRHLKRATCIKATNRWDNGQPGATAYTRATRACQHLANKQAAVVSSARPPLRRPRAERRYFLSAFERQAFRAKQSAISQQRESMRFNAFHKTKITSENAFPVPRLSPWRFFMFADVEYALFLLSLVWRANILEHLLFFAFTACDVAFIDFSLVTHIRVVRHHEIVFVCFRKLRLWTLIETSVFFRWVIFEPWGLIAFNIWRGLQRNVRKSIFSSAGRGRA